MKKDTTSKILEEQLQLLANLSRGYCPANEISCCLAIITLFCKESLFNGIEPSFDTSHKHSQTFADIWNISKPLWRRFTTACGDARVMDAIDIIQKLNLTQNQVNKAFGRILAINAGDSMGYFYQPEAITDLGIALLNYQGGTVYNPFAGLASYGKALKIGDNYHADEIMPGTWAMGVINMLINGTTSRNFTHGDSIESIGYRPDEEPMRTYDYVISTPPFGYKIKPFQYTAEELLLSKADRLLSPNGTMVLFINARIANGNGRIRDLRTDITERNLLDAVIALPTKSFAPLTNVSTLALVLKRGREDKPVRMIDARPFTTTDGKTTVIDSKAIISQIDSPNHTRFVSRDAMRHQDYSWHPGKYEDEYEEKLEPGYLRSHLKEFLIQTGTPSEDSGNFHCISLADLSSNPFDFRRSVLSFPIKHIGENAEDVQELHQLKDNLTLIEENISRHQSMIQEIEEKIKHRTLDLEAASRFIIEETAQREKEAAAKIDEIDSLIKRIECDLDNAFNNPQGLNRDFIRESQSSREYLITERQHLFEKLGELRERSAIEAKKAGQVLREESSYMQKDYEILRMELYELKKEQSDTVLKINELSEARNVTRNRKMTKVVHPSLILGGNKPSLKFAFIDASPSSPVYLSSNHCFAFKVDTTSISLEYLVYQISEIVFKDFGETIPLISRQEILNAAIIVTDLNSQRMYLAEREERAFPDRARIRSLEEELTFRDEAIASKHHELGHYRYRLFNCSTLLYQFISTLPESTPELKEALRYMDIIDENLIDLQNAIEDLDRHELYPVGSPVDMLDFFNDYSATHTGGSNYTLRFETDILSYDQEDRCMVSISESALRRIIHNIRTNAEVHGFADDETRNDYEIIIRLSVDNKTDSCIIDFINNGVPFEKDFSEANYADPEGTAPPHPGTGKGGAEVDRTCKAYGGSFRINPDDSDPDLTTIRLYFPLYHE